MIHIQPLRLHLSRFLGNVPQGQTYGREQEHVLASPPKVAHLGEKGNATGARRWARGGTRLPSCFLGAFSSLMSSSSEPEPRPVTVGLWAGALRRVRRRCSACRAAMVLWGVCSPARRGGATRGISGRLRMTSSGAGVLLSTQPLVVLTRGIMNGDRYMQLCAMNFPCRQITR